MTKPLSIILLLSLLSGTALLAQEGRSLRASTSCTQNLTQAEDRYKAGILQGIPQLLTPCLNAGNFSKEEGIRAHRLLTLVHIFNDNEALAEESMIKLLKADPEHPYDQVLDPAEFIFLYKKFRTQPIFRIGMKGVVNSTSANVITSYNTNTILSPTKTYTSGVGIGAEVTFEKEMLRNIELVGGLGAHARSFSYAQSAFGFESAPAPGDRESNGPSEVLENQSWIDLFGAARFFYPLGKLVPYAQAGVAVNYLLNTSEDITRGAIATSGINLVDTENRNQLNFALLGALGVKYKVGVDFLTLEARYMHGMTNIVNTRNRYPLPTSFDNTGGSESNAARQDRLFSTGVVDDNFGINSIMISVGYIKSFYNPKKLNEYK